jgi:hypothetical protein
MKSLGKNDQNQNGPNQFQEIAFGGHNLINTRY